LEGALTINLMERGVRAEEGQKGGRLLVEALALLGEEGRRDIRGVGTAKLKETLLGDIL